MNCCLRNFSALLLCGLSLALAACDQTKPRTSGRHLQARQITELQYRNTIADIFGPNIAVVGRFDPPTRTEGLLAEGASRISMSAATLEQFDSMAQSIADQVVAPPNRDALLPCEPGKKTEPDDTCAQKFLSEVGRLLYRRPLSEQELHNAVDVAHKNAELLHDFYAGMSFALSELLTAPPFLFLVEHATPNSAATSVASLDGYSKATRLSFFLWNSSPDDQLLSAAARGELDTKVGFARQVDRLIASPRIEAGLRAFLDDWLVFEDFDSLSKDTKRYPQFTQAVKTDAREQTLRTVIQVLMDQNGDFRDIFTTRKTFLSRPLAMLNGLNVEIPEGAWIPYEFPAGDKRVGILTQPAFVALHSPAVRSSATIRGKALREIFLCQKIPAPPPNVNFTVIQDTSNPEYKTARERLVAHRNEPACAGCHKLTDTVGLSLENFDGAGRIRDTENGVPIDAEGELNGASYTDVTGLAAAIHDDPACASCIVTRLYEYGVGGSLSKDEKPLIDSLVKSFASDHYHFLTLLRHVATSDAFYRVSPPGAERVTALQ